MIAAQPLSAGLVGGIFLLVFAVGAWVRVTRAIRVALSGEERHRTPSDRHLSEAGRPSASEVPIPRPSGRRSARSRREAGGGREDLR